MPDLSEYPKSLQILLGKLGAAVAALMGQLETHEISLQDWQLTFEDLLARYSTAAYMAGAGTPAMTEAEKQKVKNKVQVQMGFLDNFAIVIQAEREFREAWKARAEQYVKSIVAPYWSGQTKMLPLPAMPGEGSQCLNNCKCQWDIVPVNAAVGDYDCYWKLNPAEHCQTCLQRAKDWNPLKIRLGRLVIPVSRKDRPALASLKHLLGQHDQRAHGYRHLGAIGAGPGGALPTRNILGARMQDLPDEYWEKAEGHQAEFGKDKKPHIKTVEYRRPNVKKFFEDHPLGMLVFRETNVVDDLVGKNHRREHIYALHQNTYPGKNPWRITAIDWKGPAYHEEYTDLPDLKNNWDRWYGEKLAHPRSRDKKSAFEFLGYIDAATQKERLFIYKHLTGQHDQQRHGYRYGSTNQIQNTLRSTTNQDEREEIKRRARIRSGHKPAEALDDRVRHAEMQIRDSSVEHCLVFDRQGQLQSETLGNEHEVEFSYADAYKMKDCVVTHNHPGGSRQPPNTPEAEGYPFSTGDIYLAAFSDVAEIRVVTPGEFSYSMKRPKKGWPKYYEVEGMVESILQRIRPIYWTKARNNEIPMGLADLEIVREKWRLFSAITGATFTQIKNKRSTRRYIPGTVLDWAKYQLTSQKHLEGQHDQSTHGNWANKVTEIRNKDGSLSPEDQAGIISSLRRMRMPAGIVREADWSGKTPAGMLDNGKGYWVNDLGQWISGTAVGPFINLTPRVLEEIKSKEPTDQIIGDRTVLHELGHVIYNMKIWPDPKLREKIHRASQSHSLELSDEESAAGYRNHSFINDEEYHADTFGTLFLGRPKTRRALLKYLKDRQIDPQWFTGGLPLRAKEIRITLKHLPGQHDQQTHGSWANAAHPRNRRQTEGSPAFKAWFEGSKIVDKNGRPLIVYHGTPTSGEHSNNKYVQAEQAGVEYPDFQAFDTSYGGVTDSGWLGRGSYFTPDPDYAWEFGNKIIPVYLSVKNPFEIYDDGSTGEENTYDFLETLQGLPGLPEKYKFNKELPPSKEYYDSYGDSDMVESFKVDSWKGKEGNTEYHVLSNYTKKGQQPHPGGIVESVGRTPQEAIVRFNWKRNFSGPQGFLFHIIGDIGAGNFTKMLQAAGFDGVLEHHTNRDAAGRITSSHISEILAFYSTQIKSAYANQGTFDPDNPSILKELTRVKHYPGQHNQARHGWRYGSSGDLKRTFRNNRRMITGALNLKFDTEIEEFKRRARLRAGQDPEQVLYKRIRSEELKIRDLPFEMGIAFDKDGKALFHQLGETTMVPITEENWKRMDHKDAIFTHNHPSGKKFPDPDDPRNEGWPFSIQDIQCASNADLAEMRVVTSGQYSYSFKRPETGWPNPRFITGLYNEIIQQWYPIYQQRAREGEMDPRVMDLDLHRFVYGQLAKRIGARFSQLSGPATRRPMAKLPKQSHQETMFGSASQYYSQQADQLMADLGSAISQKHHPGGQGHDQKRHGWRYGSASAMKLTMRRINKRYSALGVETDPEVEEYKRRARVHQGATPQYALYRKIKDVELVFHSQKVENGAAFTQDGQEIFRKVGKETEVPISESEFNALRGRDAIFTHNHPEKTGLESYTGRSSTLSESDIFFAIHADIKEVRAVNALGTVTRMARPKNGWPYEVVAEKFYSEFMTEKRAEARNYVEEHFTGSRAEGALKAQTEWLGQFTRQAYWEAHKAFAKKFGAEFSFSSYRSGQQAPPKKAEQGALFKELTSEKHSPGGHGHDQQRHGWRYGSAGQMKRTMRRINAKLSNVDPLTNWDTWPKEPDSEVEEYKRRARIRTGQTPRYALERKIKDVELLFHAEKIEHGAVFSKDGQELIRKTGEALQIQWSDSEIDTMRRNKEAILVHNHPGEQGLAGTSGNDFVLSDGDILFAVNANLKEVRAVNTLGNVTRMIRPKNGWPNKIDAKVFYAKTFNANIRKATLEYERRYRQGTSLAAEQENHRLMAELSHQAYRETHEAFAREYGAQYLSAQYPVGRPSPSGAWAR